MAALIVLMTVAAYPQAAKADHKSGEVLLSFCDAEFVSTQQLCMLYIEGVLDGYEAHIHSTAKEMPWCIPGVLTVGQVADVVVRGLKKRPEILHYSAGILVSAALIEAFPCN